LPHLVDDVELGICPQDGSLRALESGCKGSQRDWPVLYPCSRLVQIQDRGRQELLLRWHVRTSHKEAELASSNGRREASNEACSRPNWAVKLARQPRAKVTHFARHLGIEQSVLRRWFTRMSDACPAPAPDTEQPHDGKRSMNDAPKIRPPSNSVGPFVPGSRLARRQAMPAALEALFRACAISSGRGALECVQPPESLDYPPGARALRLMRQSRISAW
jgi:hypothetical protein